MTTQSDTLLDLSRQIDGAYQDSLEVSTMLDTLRMAHQEILTGHMAEIILERNNIVAEVLDITSKKLANLVEA